MIDVERQMAYWREGAKEDMAVGSDLIARQKPRHGLFFVHLALEKALKAIVCRRYRTKRRRKYIISCDYRNWRRLSPRRSILTRLPKMNAFNLEGRYPDLLQPSPTPAEASDVFVPCGRGLPMVDPSVAAKAKELPASPAKDKGLPSASE